MSPQPEALPIPQSRHRPDRDRRTWGLDGRPGPSGRRDHRAGPIGGGTQNIMVRFERGGVLCPPARPRHLRPNTTTVITRLDDVARRPFPEQRSRAEVRRLGTDGQFWVPCSI